MTIVEMKKWIDDSDYQTLLNKWRFAPVGDPFFIGEVGDYYSKRMIEKRSAIGDEAAANASKAVGWDAI